jgi:hypothetical protein
MLRMLILLVLSCLAKINSTCFEQQESVGGSPGSGSTETMITNIDEVANVTTEYRVSAIETCFAESGGLSGVRASLSIWNATS